MPASRAALYTLKPTLNTVDMDGIFKSTAELDAIGGLAKSTADLALLAQTVLTDDARLDLPPRGYLECLTKSFEGLQIGFLDPRKWSLHPDIVQLDESILTQMVGFPISIHHTC